MLEQGAIPHGEDPVEEEDEDDDEEEIVDWNAMEIQGP